MNDFKFSRELKELLYYIREYGIQHVKYIIESYDQLPQGEEQQNEFFTQVHKGFYMAQSRVIYLLKKTLAERKRLKQALKQARRQNELGQASIILEAINKAEYQEHVLRKVVDSIAWQIFHSDLTIMRRLYCGNELIDITDSNIESEIAFTETYQQDHPEGFALINDLTSFVQIGDIVSVCKTEGVRIRELKEGVVNERIFEIINNSLQVDCPNYLRLCLSNENEKFREQFGRVVNQAARNIQVEKTIQTGYGTDVLTGQKVIVNDSDLVLHTFEKEVYKLSADCKKRGYSITVIEGCLLVGMYDISKCSSQVFNLWTQSLGISMPIYDIRQSFFDPLSFPLFLHGLAPNTIVDLVSGKKELKLTLDIEQWLETFKSDGYEVRWLSKKETARINGKMKGNQTVFSLKGCGVEIKREGYSLELGEGVFSRMFTRFVLPSSIKKLLSLSLESSYLDEVEKRNTGDSTVCSDTPPN